MRSEKVNSRESHTWRTMSNHLLHLLQFMHIAQKNICIRHIYLLQLTAMRSFRPIRMFCLDGKINSVPREKLSRPIALPSWPSPVSTTTAPLYSKTALPQPSEEKQPSWLNEIGKECQKATPHTNTCTGTQSLVCPFYSHFSFRQAAEHE